MGNLVSLCGVCRESRGAPVSSLEPHTANELWSQQLNLWWWEHDCLSASWMVRQGSFLSRTLVP